jgi:hypothetical protein
MVETRRLSSYGSTGFNLYSPTAIPAMQYTVNVTRLTRAARRSDNSPAARGGSTLHVTLLLCVKTRFD